MFAHRFSAALRADGYARSVVLKTRAQRDGESNPPGAGGLRALIPSIPLCATAIWSATNPKHRSGNRRHPRIRLVGNDGNEIVDAMDALGGDDAKFRQMRPQRIDQHRPLPDQQLPCPVHQQNRLLLRRLHRDEPHRRPQHRLANRLGTAASFLLRLT